MLRAVVDRVPFRAYAADHRISGEIELADERLTDLLNRALTLVVHDARLVDREDGHVVERTELVLDVHGLCAVEGAGPRGDPRLRVQTHSQRLQLQVGPYLVAGRLHALALADPASTFARRATMVPLTGATVAYYAAGAIVLDDLPTLVVNREFVDSIRPTGDEYLAFPDVPILEPDWSFG